MDVEIKKLIQWLADRGFDFRFSRDYAVDFTTQTVTAYRSQNKLNLLYSLLHECGHVMLYKQNGYKKQFKSLFKAQRDARHYKSNLYCYKKLKEELDAWERGKRLAKKLKIEIDIDDYDKYAAKWFMTYVRHFQDSGSAA